MKRLLSILLLIASTAHAKKEGSAFVDSLVQALPQTHDDSNKVKILATISYSCWSFNPGMGTEYGEKALALAEKLDWKPGIAGSNTALAMNYRSKGDYQEAMVRYKKSLAAWQALGNKKRIAQTYFMLSMAAIDQSDYPTALDNALTALRTSEELHDSDNIGRTLINIGIIYDDLGNYTKAVEYHTLALKLYKRRGDDNGIISAFSNLGLVYKEQKQYARSIETLLAGLKLSEGTAYRNKRSVLLGFLGDAYKDTGAYSTALQYLEDAKRIDAELGNKSAVALRYQTIGQTYLRAATDSMNGNPDPILKRPRSDNLSHAIDALQQAATMHLETGNIKDLSENHRDLAMALQFAGRHKEAFDHHVQYMAWKDSFSSTIKSKQFRELETKYETRQKDARIADQQKQLTYNRKINLSLALSSALFLVLGTFVYVGQRRTKKLNKLVTDQKKELERVNAVKDRIFSVISHDLRTPVNSLISFTDLLDHGNIPPEKMQRYADTLKNNLGHTATLMENLLNWARSQMQGYKAVPEHFDIAEVSTQVAGQLQQQATDKSLHIYNNIAANTIVFADMNMTALVLRNLLSNAIKYSPKGGTITLFEEQINGAVLIHIVDTGVGIASRLVDDFNNATIDQPLESTPGTNKEKGTGLGLMLCKGFMKLMNGRLTLQSQPGKGSRFTIQLPGQNA